MTPWLVLQTARHAPRRLVLAALGVAFPVAMLAATLLFVDLAVNTMTGVALQPVQLEQRALATSLDIDAGKLTRDLANIPAMSHVDRFAAADVVVRVPGVTDGASARLFAVDPSYFRNHPWVKVADGSFGQGALLDQSHTLSTQPTRDGYAGDQTLFAPAFTTTDDELAEMVSRLADTVRQVAEDVESGLSTPSPVGGQR